MPDQTALRDRIAAALLARIKQATVSKAHPHDAFTSLLAATEYDLADAVLAVLPPPADRGAVLLWAADRIDAETRQLKADEVLEPDKFRPCRDASAQLRRMAAEAQPPTSATCPHCKRWYVTSEPGAHEAACPQAKEPDPDPQPVSEEFLQHLAAVTVREDDVIAPYCDGFPDTCPSPVTVPPTPPHHGGGIRCGCYDGEEAHHG